MASALFSVNRKYQSPTVTNEIKTSTYPATAAARAKKYGNGSENKKGPEREEGKTQSQTKRNHEEKSRQEFHMKPPFWEFFIIFPISSFGFYSEE
jgi:hypothetical protein